MRYISKVRWKVQFGYDEKPSDAAKKRMVMGYVHGRIDEAWHRDVPWHALGDGCFNYEEREGKRFLVYSPGFNDRVCMRSLDYQYLKALHDDKRYKAFIKAFDYQAAEGIHQGCDEGWQAYQGAMMNDFKALIERAKTSLAQACALPDVSQSTHHPLPASAIRMASPAHNKENREGEGVTQSQDRGCRHQRLIRELRRLSLNQYRALP